MNADTTDLATLVLRIVVAAIFLAQSRPKVLARAAAPKGRDALAQTLAGRGLPIPNALALAVGVTEFVGGALILVGLGTRPTAAALALIMVAAIVLVKWRQGFVGGWDWPLSVLASLVALTLLGGGSLSIDAALHAPLR